MAASLWGHLHLSLSTSEDAKLILAADNDGGETTSFYQLLAMVGPQRATDLCTQSGQDNITTPAHHLWHMQVKQAQRGMQHVLSEDSQPIVGLMLEHPSLVSAIPFFWVAEI